jgi:hypothetical protein
VKFMERAADEANRALRTGVPETEREIRSYWERP